VSAAVMENINRNWVIGATLAGVDLVCAEILNCLVEAHLVDHIFPAQMLARESLNNAVLHGCCQDKSRQVRCQFRIDDKTFSIEVDDGGPGFNWQCEMEQEVVLHEREHGRGLLIYRLYADRVEFNPSGNCVKLVRFLIRNFDGKKTAP
jgi:serine/threonine-protein kinase RsbW